MDIKNAGLIESLFDFTFHNFITPKIVAILYVLFIALGALWTLLLIVAAFTQSVVGGVIVLVVSPIILALVVVIARVYMELLVIAFRGVEYLRKIAGEPEPASQAPPVAGGTTHRAV